MNVLVACECSGRVRDAFRALGHDAWSCDLKPAEGRQAWHIQDDALKVARTGWFDGFDPHGQLHHTSHFRQWDLMIAHPDCTYLSGSGWHWVTRGRIEEDGRPRREHANEALVFVVALSECPIPRIAIENPIGRLSTLWREPDQTIQPWEFGDDASKATCLWLKGLPKLYPVNELGGGRRRRRANQTASGQNKLSPSPERKANRARTYPGIAAAMAEQWSAQLWTVNS